MLESTLLILGNVFSFVVVFNLFSNPIVNYSFITQRFHAILERLVQNTHYLVFNENYIF